MNAQDIVKALTPLADKLGQGAAVLWQSALRENYVLAVTDIIWGFVWIALGVAGILVIKHFWPIAKKEATTYDFPNGWLLGLIPAVLAIMLGIGLWTNSFDHFYNPILNTFQIIVTAGKTQ